MSLRALAVDVTPLRTSRDFRILWLGLLVSFTGSMLTFVALPFQVYELTGSSLAVGLLGLAELVPLLVASLWGGAVADAVDRRTVLRRAYLALALTTLAMAVNAGLDDPQLWVLYVAGGAASALNGIAQSSMRSLVPLIVPSSQRPAAFALMGVYATLGMLLGPLLAGVLIASIGLAATFALDVASYGAAFAAATLIAPRPPAPDADRASLQSIVDGLRFVRGRPEILGTFWVDLVAMVFGMPRALFPALSERLGGGPRMLGLLYGAISLGALVATLTSGWTGRVRRQGAAVLWAVGAWGVAIAAVGVVRAAWLAVAFLALAGAADMVSAIFRSTITADATPDELRGRVVGLEWAVVVSGPLLGDAEAGIVAGLAGVPVAIVSGGVACVTGAAVLWRRLPAFAGYEKPSALRG